jgi:hypothetical protein
MKTTISLIFTFIVTTSFLNLSLAQSSYKPVQLPTYFDQEREISGLCKKDSLFYLPAEKQEIIFVIKLENNICKHIESIHLKNIDKNLPELEIEAITSYKNYLIFTDETCPKIYYYNLNSKALDTISGFENKLDGGTKNFGLEGITILKDKLFILREKNKKRQSEIHSFSISEKDGKLTVNNSSHKKMIINQNSSARYSGMCINPQNQSLLCLRSRKYKSYLIDEIILDDNNIPSGVFDRNTSPVICFDSVHQVKKSSFYKKYNSNIEGIYMDYQFLYIISDNRKHSDNTVLKTAFLKKRHIP